MLRSSVFVFVALSFALPRAALAASGAELDAKIEALARDRAPGTSMVGDFYRGEPGGRGARTDWRVELDPTQCYWFVGQGDDGVESFTLFLFEPDENAFSGRAATERSKTSSAVMMHCPTKSGMYRLQLKVTKGGGEYTVGVFAKAAPKKVVAAPPENNLGQLVDKEAASMAPGAARVGEYLAGDTDVSDWNTMFEAGKCYWVVAVGEPDISGLYLYLWDPNNKRVTQAYSKSNKSSMGHCPTEAGMFHIQAKLTSGSGAYKVGVYAKKK